MKKQNDKYGSFEELAVGEVDGVTYRIRVADRSPPIVVVSPHGGTIEPGTSKIALEIADDRFSLYRFEGLVADIAHEGLHITSERFNEPQAVQLVEAAETVIGVHGRADDCDGVAVWVGGLDVERRDRIAAEFERNGFNAEIRERGQSLAGAQRANICNRGTTGAGVQLEIPRALRNPLRERRDARGVLGVGSARVRSGVI